MIRRYYIVRDVNNPPKEYWHIDYCTANNVEPLIEYRETGDRLIATLDLPCVEKESIDVSSEEYCVRVCAPTNRGICFKKVINLPFATEPENVSATFKKGVLVLEIPKKVKHFKVEIK